MNTSYKDFKIEYTAYLNRNLKTGEFYCDIDVTSIEKDGTETDVDNETLAVIEAHCKIRYPLDADGEPDYNMTTARERQLTDYNFRP